MAQILPYIQIVLSFLLVGGILLQRSEAGLGSAFGQDGMTAGQHTRRGMERTLFYGTILVAVLFGISAFASLFVGR
jgi:protein translocase SecG subunit